MKYARYVWILVVIAFLVGGSTALSAQETKEKKTKGKPVPIKEKKSKVKEVTKETTHEIVIDGKKIKYNAVAGTMLLKKDEKDPAASIFYIAYTKSDEKNPAKRPITFSFNGGPGSSSVSTSWVAPPRLASETASLLAAWHSPWSSRWPSRRRPR